MFPPSSSKLKVATDRPQHGDILIYDGPSERWKPMAVPAVAIAPKGDHDASAGMASATAVSDAPITTTGPQGGLLRRTGQSIMKAARRVLAGLSATNSE
jgi:hypothetical protein